MRSYLMLAVGAAIVASTLTGCAPPDAQCPVSASDMTIITGGEVSAKFNDWKRPADAPDRNDRNCMYIVRGGIAGMRDVYLEWTPEPFTLPDGEDFFGEPMADLGEWALIKADSGSDNFSNPSVRVTFQKDGYVWTVLTSGIDEPTIPLDARVESLTAQTIQIGQKIAAVTYGPELWER